MDVSMRTSVHSYLELWVGLQGKTGKCWICSTPLVDFPALVHDVKPRRLPRNALPCEKLSQEEKKSTVVTHH